MIKNIYQLVFSKSRYRTIGQERYRRILHAGISAIGSKGVALLVSLVSVPLTVEYLGAERYAVWMMISALLAWLTLVDFGLVNGLQTLIAKNLGNERQDIIVEGISTTLIILLCISICMGLIYAIVNQWVSWPRIFAVHTELASHEVTQAVNVAIIIFLISLPLNIIHKILIGYQEGVISNYWNMIASLASLIGIIIITKLNLGLMWLVLGYSGLQTLVLFISALWLFYIHKPELRPRFTNINRQRVNDVISVGGMFFLAQLSTLFIFQTDNFIISHWIAIEDVTVYSVCWRLFTYVVTISGLFLPYMWPALGEAYARGDLNWVWRTLSTYLKFSLIITIILVVPLIYYGQTIIRYWAGDFAVPDYSLLIWMGGWCLITTTLNVLVALLGGIGKLKKYAAFSLIAAISNLILSILFANLFGLSGVIAASVISTILFIMIPVLSEVLSVCNKRFIKL